MKTILLTFGITFLFIQSSLIKPFNIEEALEKTKTRLGKLGHDATISTACNTLAQAIKMYSRASKLSDAARKAAMVSFYSLLATAILIISQLPDDALEVTKRTIEKLGEE